MAEGVQFQLERQLEELEQMVHCGLFTKQETAAIVKKRKQCEYKVHRRTKSKEDYLQYIRYESALLALLRKRREKEGYGFRKKEIDEAILNRVHSLFRAAIKRFQGDVSLWLTYIEFCKEKRNHAMVSRTFSDLLAIHNHDPALWIMAAQWELEENKDAETARSLLQRGLRFLAESTTLWKEYLRMELIHVETMRKRMLTLTAAADEGAAAAAAGSDDDPILSGKIIGVVYRQAVAAMPDNVDLLFDLLEVAKVFAETLPDLEGWIYEDLTTKYATEARAWDALARRHLDGPRGTTPAKSTIVGGDEDIDVERRRVAEVERRESAASAAFEEGLTVASDVRLLTKLAVGFAVEALEKGEASEPTLTPRRLASAVGWLRRAEAADNAIDEDLYLDWIRILRNFADDDDDYSVILERALIQVPTSFRLWSIRLQKTINESGFDDGGADRVRQTLEAAVEKVHEKDSWTLWETYLDWLTRTSDDAETIDAAFRRAASTTGREASKLAKEAYVKYAAEHSSAAAAAEGGRTGEVKRVYDWLRLHRPHSKEYFRFVIGRLEETEAKRRVYLDAVEELGKTDVDLWLEFQDFESKLGNAEVGYIYKKAQRELDPVLLPEFETKHTLTITGHINR